jgi:hypothetical protein
MEHSPSWEANRFAASQEIPRILWFITAFTNARHLSLSWANSIQPKPSHPTSYRSIIILSSHLHLDLPSGLFPQDYPPKSCTRLVPRIQAICPSHLILLYFITRTIVGEKYRLWRFSLWSFLRSPVNLVPLKNKYSPQHPILKHPQPMFLPQCKRPSFTPIQNNRLNYRRKIRIYKFYACCSVHFGNKVIVFSNKMYTFFNIWKFFY